MRKPCCRNSNAAVCPLLQHPGKAIVHAGLLLPLLLASACNTGNIRNASTLSSLEQISISVQDEKVDDSLHKAMASYREYIKQASAANDKAKAAHRLADLEVEKRYRIDGVEAPAAPGANAAIDHYTRLLAAYPQYDHNDRVLYQLSRAYEEAGESHKAVETLEQLAARYPDFERIDEVNFRLGEHYFTEKQYPRASKAYAAVLAFGEQSAFLESALNKQGWSYYRQDEYTRALTYFIAALDQVYEQADVPGGASSRLESRQIDDAHRAISLSFSYLGGADAIEAYIRKNGDSVHEQAFYRHLAEYYLSKDRYTDAARTYQAWIDKYPYAETAPSYAMRIIEIYQSGGFIDLSITARKNFAIRYGPSADYWQKSGSKVAPVSVEYQKENIRILAKSFHARYKQPATGKDKHDSYQQAVRWYREYYYHYPLDEQAPQMSKLLAELHLENGDYRSAALEFEHIARNNPASDLAADSAYAALYAYRENLKTLPESRRRSAREDIAEKSLRFADQYPHHAETGTVLISAAYDFLKLTNHTAATDTAKRVILQYPDMEASQLRPAWIVRADAAFESGRYAEAENAYSRALAMTAPDDSEHAALTENLAASIYRQAEYARARNDHSSAAQHFMRLKSVAPDASLSASAQYEAASALVTIGEWSRAAVVLEDFQKQNPAHELSDVTTRNLAAIYRKNDELLKSAEKLERVAAIDDDADVRRDALFQAADLYRQANNQPQALRVYTQYTRLYPSPAETAIEACRHIADIYKSNDDIDNYHQYLWKIVSIDEKAGGERTDRTRYLAAQSLLVLAQTRVQAFMTVELTRPFKPNLDLKKQRMSDAVDLLSRLLEYQISETTTAATFYVAEIYLHFSQALTGSERPTGLSDLELEQYELALEEQAYLFEDKAITVYQKNTELLDAGIHDPWVEKSMARLSSLFPAQYAKQEQKSGYLKSLFAVDDRT